MTGKSKHTLRWETVLGRDITDSLIDEVKGLFDSSYGFWSSSHAPNSVLSGQPIHFPRKSYIEYFRGSEKYAGECDLVLCYDGERLVGEAIYVNKDTPRGKVALVVQLVVHKDYRRLGIGSKLLYSIWGFSDYYAWGIVTSNPCTIKTLEKATSRQCSVRDMVQNKNFLSAEVLAGISFLDESRDSWVINNNGKNIDSRIKTGFATERLKQTEVLTEIESRLGRIGPKEEWMAFIFNSQEIKSDIGFKQMLDESNDIVRDAYRRMDIKRQKWTAAATSEVDEILKMTDLRPDASICDFGAGQGRHLEILRTRGFADIVGIDFAAQGESDLVVEGDCRDWKGAKPFDLILCLYDVIGSFRELEDNTRILSNIHANLRPGGKAVISVMNLDFCGMDCAEVVGNEPDELYAKLRNLKPSMNMAKTGEVFDGRYALVNREEGVVYRKEQFDGDGNSLRCELVVVDRRFTAETIKQLCKKAGFEVLELRYARAGFRKPSLLNSWRAARWGKEIVLLLQKSTKPCPLIAE